jgi:predicted transcriptional regulator of viral defense system
MARRVDASGRVDAFVADLQAGGRYAFVTDEVAATARDRSAVAVDSALRRLRARGRIVSPRRGFHVVVPPEYRSAGCPPASWFVDDLMRFLDQPYYVGPLTAAALHGAGHQQPLTFQVVTDRPTRPVAVGRVRLEFHRSSHVETAPVVDLQTETGTMRVSSPAGTAFDLVHLAAASGHLDNVFTVLAELAETMDPRELHRLACSRAVPEAQRLGYLLDRLGRASLADAVAAGLAGRRQRVVRLATGRPRGNEHPDDRWRVIPNRALEVET